MSRLASVLLALVAFPAAGQQFTGEFPLDDLHFLPFGGQPHFILNPGHRLVLEGMDAGEAIELTVTALNQTKRITLPSTAGPRAINARVIEEREVVNGALTEVGRFWYARAIETGDVYFFGEEVDFYNDDVLVGTTLLWEAGTNGALPGIIMPRTFLLGARYYQNQAVAAVDGAENVALGVTMATPAGTFSNCVQIRETDTLKPEEGTATKTYAPGIGLVNDDDILRLTDFWLGTAGLPAGGVFAPFSHHPFFPFAPGHQWVLEGNEEDRETVLTITALEETRTLPVTIAGEQRNLSTRVIEGRKSSGGQLVEVSRSFFAQCVETGDVHLFGREVDRYAGGAIVGHEGSWQTGVDGAEAGIFMPANFAVGARYLHQTAPGAANDVALNSASGLSAVVPLGAFSNCVRVTVTSLLETNAVPREMVFAPGIGMISDREVLRLTSFVAPDLASGAPVLAILDAVLLTWPLTDNPLVPQSSSNLQDWAPIPQIPLPADGRYFLSFPRDRAQQYFRLVPP